MNRLRRITSWRTLGAALLGIILARWTWLLFAPVGAAMAPATWQASPDSGQLFGKAPLTAGATATAAPPANIKLIGVFANRTKGFAVMEVNNKQIGVAQGDDVSPGVRLEETHADYVVLSQGGVRQRVMLSGAPSPGPGSPAAGIRPAAPPAMPGPRPPAPRTAPGRQAVMQRVQLLRKQLAANPNMPPPQKARIQQQIENLQRGVR